MEISDKNIGLTGKWIKIMKMRINKMHTRHKRGYKFTDKKQSKRGIAAWILSVISLGGSNCSHCLFFSGWRKRKHVSWECGCVVHVRWSDRIVQCNCKLKRGKFLSFFSLSCDRMLFPCCWGMGCAVYSWIFAVNKEKNWCENKIFTRRNGEFI